MRTTVTIDDHLLAEAKALAARQHRTLSDLVQDGLREALRARPPLAEPFVLPTSGGPQGHLLVDLLDKEALADVLGDNEWPRRDD